MSISPSVLCTDLDYCPKNFYHMVRFLAWEAHCQGEYSKLLSAKAGAK